MNNPREDSPLLDSSEKEKTSSRTELNQSSKRNSFTIMRSNWEWWERPSDAVGTVQYFNFSAERDSSQSLNNHKTQADEIRIDPNSTDENEEGKEIASMGGNSGHHRKKLNSLMATSISGNDIASSVLYVSGYAVTVCGVFSPIALLLVSLLLALFRPIYTEAVTALPMNGGTYNVLLNTTSKQIASIAAALSLLSYVATAVVSATSAMQYLQSMWGDLPIYYAVIIVLGIFAVLNLLGITESAMVATIIFICHCVTLLVLIACGCIAFDRQLLHDNWNQQSQQFNQPWLLLIFLGFGASMLGITGFETSANFVEQQAPGVFAKTLRNMWAVVTFFNPTLSFLSLGLLSLDQMHHSNNTGALLANMAKVAVSGDWLHKWVVIDAVIVLSGAVLTAYVGVGGLARRLALDRILPQFLLHENRLRKTNHWIIISFFLLCSSLFLLIATEILPGTQRFDPKVISTKQVDTLNGVYTSAFLCVMAMFAAGNMLLKYKRSKLPRDVYTPWPIVLIAFFGVIAAFVGNVLVNLLVLGYFALYFTAAIFLFILMFMRIQILKIVLYFCSKLTNNPRIQSAIARKIQEINDRKVIFFITDKYANVATMNRAILYIRNNEQTNWIQFVHVYKSAEEIPSKLEESIKFLNSAYPKFRIDLLLIQGEFNPSLVEKLSRKLSVPANFMFFACPSASFAHHVADFGGVRLITH